MATGAKSAHGVLVKMSDGGSPEVFTTIAEVLDVSGPGFKLTSIDVTNQDSTNHWREKIGGLLDGGQLTFSCNWIPSGTTQGNTAGLLYLLRTRTKRNVKVVWPDSLSTTWTLPVIVTEFSPDNAQDGQMKVSITLDVAGEPTLA